MNIKKISVGETKVPLKQPFKTALRTVNEVHSLVLIIETDNGLKGFGEAPATAVITGDLINSMRAALDLIAPQLIGASLTEFNTLLLKIHRSVVHHNSLKAALEIALFDLRAQSMRVPLYQLLGGGLPNLKTDITISLNDSATMVNDCVVAVGQGFDALKIKLGAANWKDDVERVLSIYEAVGPNIALCLDANQAWLPKQAVQILRQIEAANIAIAFVEQPVKASDLAGLKFVTSNTLVPVLADEAVFSAADAGHILQTQAADIINIKLMKTAGISQAIEIANLTRRANRMCMIGCMLEGAISVTAAAHFAVAHQDVIRYIDLDGPQICAGSAINGGLRMDGPTIHLSDAPGLGIQELLQFDNSKVY
jgi:L-Ala-D/L-Glu epimerase